MKNKDILEEGTAKLFIGLATQDIMLKNPVTIRSDENLSKALSIFVKQRVFYLPVINSSNRLVGTLTQKYLYKIRSPRRIIDQDMEFNKEVLRDGDSFYEKETLDSYILSNIMFKTPFTMSPEDSAAEAILHMADKRLGCIPIVDDQGTIKGVLTAEEIIKYLGHVIREGGDIIGE